MLNSSSEAAILERAIRPPGGTFPVEIAHALLSMRFADSDHERMAYLSARANDGCLTGEEREELEGYINVSHFLALVQSRARLSLRGHERYPTA